MLLRINQPSQYLIKVNCGLPFARLALHQLMLQLVLEAHDHVHPITILYFKYEVVGPVVCFSYGNAASQDAFRVQLCLVDHLIDVVQLNICLLSLTIVALNKHVWLFGSLFI